ncbi:MAG: NF038122 family metalloprotease [Pseudomonadota bacterium]
MKLFLKSTAAILAASLALAAPSAKALIIDLNFSAPGVDPGVAAAAEAGFRAAARQWERKFSDAVTVRLNVGFAPLGAGIIGQAGSTTGLVPYDVMRTALTLDATTRNDATAVAHLPGGSSISFFTNTVGLEGGSPEIIFDDGSGLSVAENQLIRLSTANAKALGFSVPDTVVDGTITFNSDFNFDFDPSDGVDGDAFDFVGTALHEIGHTLGFISGVDFVDVYSGFGPGADDIRTILEEEFGLPRDLLADANLFDALSAFIADGVFGNLPQSVLARFTPLDLFRYSDLSFDENGNFVGFDFTTGLGLDRILTPEEFLSAMFGNDVPYFSIDGGKTNLGAFSFGRYNGAFLLTDGESVFRARGQQASHWMEVFAGVGSPTRPGELLFGAPTTPIGALDPTGSFGEKVFISRTDLSAFDAIGYDLIPEPGMLGLLGLGLAGVGALHRRRRKV